MDTNGKENKKQRYFVISDVHGEYDKMLSALEGAGFDKYDKNHTLITAGDMFDRGPKSKEVFHFLMGLENVISVLGNHDEFLLDYLTDPEGRTAYFNVARNGLDKTLQSLAEIDEATMLEMVIYRPYDLAQIIINKHPELRFWLRNLPLYHETDSHIIVHAGLNPTLKDWKDSDKSDFIWQHDFLLRGNTIPKTIVVGHMHTWRQRIAVEEGFYGSWREKHPQYEDNIDTSTFKYHNVVSIDGVCNADVGQVNVYTFEE